MNAPLYHRLSLQDLRLVISVLRDGLLEGAQSELITPLHKIDHNEEAAAICTGEQTHLVGTRALFFKLLEQHLQVIDGGRGYRFSRGDFSYSGKLLHHNAPVKEELRYWVSAGGGRQRYLEDCGEGRSWVYCREYGCVSVPSGHHQLFMSFLLFKLTDRMGEYRHLVGKGSHKWADEFLQLPGTAFNSSVGGNHVVATEGNLTPEEIVAIRNGGYEIKFFKVTKTPRLEYEN
ncbi:MAG: hypothetical protein ACRCTP_03595 [Aeromonas popoffii]|uniref:hypothetical protein n=1 Tax=Aeromonas popoffii TaxID=70856 RepID=UPI003F3FAC00